MRCAALLAAVVTTTLFAATGCAATEDDESAEASSDAFTAATNDYESTLADIQHAYDRCQLEGKCTGEAASGDVGTQSLHPLGAPKKLLGTKLCAALRPLARFESPYFFAGMNYNATGLRTIADGGVDLVYDLRNQQAAIVRYHSEEYSNSVGVEVNVYTGYAFGRKANVLAAWSGAFQSADAVVDIPILFVSAGGKIFRTPDNSLFGGAVEGSFGINALGPLGKVEVAVGEGERTPWDAATRAYARSLYFSTYREVSTRVEGHAHTYIQFDSAKDLGLAVVESFGPVGFAPAAQAAGLAALRRQNLTIQQACR